jgi:hypothetical protein
MTLFSAAESPQLSGGSPYEGSANGFTADAALLYCDQRGLDAGNATSNPTSSHAWVSPLASPLPEFYLTVLHQPELEKAFLR